MKWTTELPTSEGFYWHREAGMPVCLIYVKPIAVGGWLHLVVARSFGLPCEHPCAIGEWAGPINIELPEEEMKHHEG